MAAKRKCSGTNKKMPSLLVVVAVAVLSCSRIWTRFLPQVNTEKVDLQAQLHTKQKKKVVPYLNSRSVKDSQSY